MPCASADILEIMKGAGAPVKAPDPRQHHPLYVDEDTGQFWVYAGGSWFRLMAPTDWLKARYLSVLQLTDVISINRGGYPGYPYDGQYLQATMAELVALVAQSLRLGDLVDVELAGVGPGDALVFRDGAWRNGRQEMVLGDVADVALQAERHGAVLYHDGNAWRNGMPQVSLDDLRDVDAASPVAGDVLQHDAATGRWVARPMVVRLADHVDVSGDPAPVDGAWLVFDGQQWLAGAGGSIQLVRCVECAEDAAGVDGLVLVVSDGRLMRMENGAATDVPQALRPQVVACCATARLFALQADGFYRQADYVPQAVFGQVLVVDCVGAGDTPPDGEIYLDTSVSPPELRTPVGGCPPLARIVWCRSGCRAWALDAVSGTYVPLGVRAEDVCVAPCGPTHPVSAATNAKDAVCLLAATTGGTVGPCTQVGAVPPTIEANMSFAQAVCELDADAVAAGVALSALDATTINVQACTSGPINSPRSLQQAICDLSQVAGNLVTLPVAATDVSVVACASGALAGAANAQDAVCQLSSAVANRSRPASSVILADCATPLLSGNMSVQDALCHLAANPPASSSVDYVYAELGPPQLFGGYYAFDIVSSQVNSPNNVFSIGSASPTFDAATSFIAVDTNVIIGTGRSLLVCLNVSFSITGGTSPTGLFPPEMNLGVVYRSTQGDYLLAGDSPQNRHFSGTYLTGQYPQVSAYTFFAQHAPVQAIPRYSVAIEIRNGLTVSPTLPVGMPHGRMFLMVV